MSLGITIFLILLGLFFEGFFSGSELSIISFDKVSLHNRVRKGIKWAKIVSDFKTNPDKLLSTTLVGTNLSVILGTTVCTLFIILNFGERYDFFSIVIMSPMILIFGEILPKILFAKYHDRLLPVTVFPLQFISKFLFSPFVGVFSFVSKALFSLVGKTAPGAFFSRDDLKLLLKVGERKSDVSSQERRMINRIFDFRMTKAGQAMIPLIDVTAVEDTISMDELIKVFKERGYSRVLVYKDRIDNLIGIVNGFDIIWADENDKNIDKYVKPVFYVPENKPLDELLLILQKEGINLAVIVDEYGGAVGIITIEDILEEIVGEIEDEHDREAKLYEIISANHFIIRGRMEVSEINELFNLRIPKGTYETIAGFLLNQMKKIPREGETFSMGKIFFTVKSATARSIDRIEIKVRV